MHLLTNDYYYKIQMNFENAQTFCGSLVLYSANNGASFVCAKNLKVKQIKANRKELKQKGKEIKRKSQMAGGWNHLGRQPISWPSQLSPPRPARSVAPRAIPPTTWTPPVFDSGHGPPGHRGVEPATG